jgi:ribonuclease E
MDTLQPSTYEKDSAAPVESGFEEKRGRGRREPRSTEPPELVTVEMTPDEQEVYAWMGISPLVLTQQDVKNPQAAMVSVVLPGETPRSQPPVSSNVPILKTKTQSTDGNSERDEIAAPVPLEPSTESEGIQTEEVEPEQPDNGTLRRRRRRSSATTSD